MKLLLFTWLGTAFWTIADAKEAKWELHHASPCLVS